MKDAGPSAFPALSFSMICTGDEPDIPDRFRMHSISIFAHDDPGRSHAAIRKPDDNLFRMSVIGILDKFKNGDTWRPDELIAKQLQNSGLGSESKRTFGTHVAIALFH